MIVYTSKPYLHHQVNEIRNRGMGLMLSSTKDIDSKTMDLARTQPVAVDNGAFSAWKTGHGFDEFGFLQLLHKIRSKKIKPQFVVCPDIVGGGAESEAFSIAWAYRLPGWPLYFAVQDGQPMRLYHVEKFRGIFVGGTVKWKWRHAEMWVRWAHEHGLKCHIGQCGTVERLKRAHELGADSCDSISFVKNGTWEYVERHTENCGGLFDE